MAEEERGLVARPGTGPEDKGAIRPSCIPWPGATASAGGVCSSEHDKEISQHPNEKLETKSPPPASQPGHFKFKVRIPSGMQPDRLKHARGVPKAVGTWPQQPHTPLIALVTRPSPGRPTPSPPGLSSTRHSSQSLGRGPPFSPAGTFTQRAPTEGARASIMYLQAPQRPRLRCRAAGWSSPARIDAWAGPWRL